MSAEENMAIVRRFAEEGWGKKNLTVVDELVAPNWVDLNPIGMLGQQQGAEGVKSNIKMMQSAFPNFSYTTEEMVADKDKVVVRWTAGGVHQGPFFGMAPTGKSATWSGVNIYRLSGGKIVAEWGLVDMLGLMQQLGGLPPMQ